MQASAQLDLKAVVKALKVAVDTKRKQYEYFYKGYSEEKRKQLAEACAVLQTSVDLIMHHMIDTKKNKFFEILGTAIDALGVRYLPSNKRRLKEYILPVLTKEKSVVEMIDLPRKGNQNGRVHEDPELNSWLFQLRSMPQNYSGIFITRKIKLMCELTGKPAPSTSWYYRKLGNNKTRFLTSEYRWGRNSRKANLYEGYVPIANALFAGDCWQIDGSRINMIEHQASDGSKKFLYGIAIRDVHSGDIPGFHLDVAERAAGYINALKMACYACGYLPYQIIVDQFPGHNSSEWQIFEKRLINLGVNISYTSVAQGKSQVERWFGTLQSVFMMESRYYYGEGIQSTRDYAHRAASYLASMRKQCKKEGWDFDAAWREACRVIVAYRDTALKDYSRKHAKCEESPRQLHNKSEKPHVIRVDEWEQALLFGLEKEVSINRGGVIKTQILNVEYIYVVDNYDVIANYRNVVLAYDLDDLSKVHLFDNTPERRFLCEAVHQDRIQIYGPQADFEALGKAKQRRDDIRQRRKEDLEAIISAGSDVDILLGGLANKMERESAESLYLTERQDEWEVHQRPRLSPIPAAAMPDTDDDDDDDLVIDIRSRY